MFGSRLLDTSPVRPGTISGLLGVSGRLAVAHAHLRDMDGVGASDAGHGLVGQTRIAFRGRASSVLPRCSSVPFGRRVGLGTIAIRPRCEQLFAASRHRRQPDGTPPGTARVTRHHALPRGHDSQSQLYVGERGSFATRRRLLSCTHGQRTAISWVHRPSC